jgi:biopolymer transport protein ExbD
MTTRHRKKRRDIEMSISSFSDIAFLLIIFFILATTLVQVSGVINEIPSGEQSQSEQDLESPTVQLENGRVLFNEKQVDMAELRRKLAELKLRERADDDKVVLLEASGNVNYQSYFDVMASISAAGGVTAILQEEDE